jgi:hypothetical protein
VIQEFGIVVHEDRGQTTALGSQKRIRELKTDCTSVKVVRSAADNVTFPLPVICLIDQQQGKARIYGRREGPSPPRAFMRRISVGS